MEKVAKLQIWQHQFQVWGNVFQSQMEFAELKFVTQTIQTKLQKLFIFYLPEKTASIERIG